MNYSLKKTRLSAFTLVELLSVIAIIGILAAIIIASVGHIRANARRTQCVSNLRQVHIGATLYAQDNKDTVVPTLPTLPGGISVTWVEVILPYVQSSKAMLITLGVRPTGVFACPDSTNLTYGGGKSDYSKNIKVTGRLRAVNFPQKIIWFGDSGNADGVSCGRELATGSGVLFARHDEQAAVVYVDGHAEAARLTSIPTDFNKWPWNPDSTN